MSSAPVATTHAPPSRDRRATAAVAVQFAVNGAFFASFMPRLPELRAEIGTSTESIGLLLTVASTSGLLGSFTVRAVIGRFGTRRVLFGGGVAVAAALTLVGLASSWPVVLLGLAAMFFFDVYVDVAMNMQGSWLSARRPRSIMNRLHGLWSLGAVIGGLVAARLAGTSITLATHLTAAAVVLVILSSVVSTQLLPTDPRPATAQPTERASGASGSMRTGFFLAGLTAVLIETAAIGWAAFRITDDLHGAASTAALAYVAVVGGMTIARFSGDHLAHWLGAARATAGSAIVATVGMVLASVIGHQAVVVGAFFVAGLGIAALTPRLYDLAARAGGGTAAGLGALTGGIRTASIVAPAAVAAVASSLSIGAALAAAALVAGAGFLAAARRVGATG